MVVLIIRAILGPGREGPVILTVVLVEGVSITGGSTVTGEDNVAGGLDITVVCETLDLGGDFDSTDTSGESAVEEILEVVV